MQIFCPHCQQKARITSRNNMNDAKTVADLYCQCLNSQGCGASFVMTLGFKHYLNPPVQSTAELAAQLLRQLSLKERKALLSGNPAEPV